MEKFKKKYSESEFVNYIAILIVLVVLCALFAFTANGFMTVRNLSNILQQVTVVGILTVGQTYVIIAKGIDLSQGAVIGLSSIFMAKLMTEAGVPIWMAAIMILVQGIAIGVINGVLIAKTKVPAMIATLGTTNIFSAIALLSCGGNNIYSLPGELAEFAGTKIGGVIPAIAVVMIVLAVISHIVLSKTRFGRYVYAIGSNDQGARFSGIKVAKNTIMVYVISGFMSAVAGLIMVCRLNSGVATAGDGYEMNSIAAVVIGGGSLYGGEGNVVGAMIGALIMSVLSNGLQLMGVSTYWQTLFVGIVLIVAVLIDNIRRKAEQ